MVLLIELLILLVVAIVVFLVAKYIMGEAELDPPIRKIVLILLALFFLIALVNVFTGFRMWGPFVSVPAPQQQAIVR